MFEEVGFISRVIRTGPLGFNVREQTFSLHPYGSPMETEIAIPKVPAFDFPVNQWQSIYSPDGEMCDTPPAVQVGDRLSGNVSVMMDMLSLHRRQSLQVRMSMDLDKTDSLTESPLEAKDVSLGMETDKLDEPAISDTIRAIQFPPTPPDTPPSLSTVQAPLVPAYTPGSMSRLRSIAPRAIATSHEDPIFTSGYLHVEQAKGYAPRLRCVSLPVVSPMSGIETDGFRDVRVPPSIELLESDQAFSLHEGLGSPWNPSRV